jgi:hypothetical protein
MDDKAATSAAAVRCWIETRRVWLEMTDQRIVGFPVTKYPRLATASAAELGEVKLRVQGRALRWEALEEDIWVEDVVLGRFPRAAEAVPA